MEVVEPALDDLVRALARIDSMRLRGDGFHDDDPIGTHDLNEPVGGHGEGIDIGHGGGGVVEQEKRESRKRARENYEVSIFDPTGLPYAHSSRNVLGKSTESESQRSVTRPRHSNRIHYSGYDE